MELNQTSKAVSLGLLLPTNPARETLRHLKREEPRMSPMKGLGKPTTLTGGPQQLDLNLHRAKSAARRSHQDLYRHRMKPPSLQTPTSSLTETGNQGGITFLQNPSRSQACPKALPRKAFRSEKAVLCLRAAKSTLVFSIWAEGTTAEVPHQPSSTKISEVHLGGYHFPVRFG